MYCSIHKLDGMINVGQKNCLYNGCKTQPAFNFEEETCGLYCSLHKLDGMIIVTHKTCKTFLCSTYVSNKYEGYCFFCYMNMFPDKPVFRNYKTKEFTIVDFVK